MAFPTAVNRSVEDLLRKNLDKLTTNITYIVLGAFVCILALLLCKAMIEYEIVNGENNGQVWLNLFKDGFLILGGILTTLIGYYFGNRGSDVALKQVESIKKENEALLQRLSTIAPTDESQKQGITPLDFPGK